METESLWSFRQFLAYGGILLAALAGIVVPLLLLKQRRRQGPPRGPRHTDPEPRPPQRTH
jgi:hypothetical protein